MHALRRMGIDWNDRSLIESWTSRSELRNKENTQIQEYLVEE